MPPACSLLSALVWRPSSSMTDFSTCNWRVTSIFLSSTPRVLLAMDDCFHVETCAIGQRRLRAPMQLSLRTGNLTQHRYSQPRNSVDQIFPCSAATTHLWTSVCWPMDTSCHLHSSR